MAFIRQPDVVIGIVGHHGPVIIPAGETGGGRLRRPQVFDGHHQIGVRRLQIMPCVQFKQVELLRHLAAVMIEQEQILDAIEEIRFAADLAAQHHAIAVHFGVGRRSDEFKTFRPDREMRDCAAIGMMKKVLFVHRGKIQAQGVVFSRQHAAQWAALVVQAQAEAERIFFQQIIAGIIAPLNGEPLIPTHLCAKSQMVSFIAAGVIIGRQLNLHAIVAAGIEGKSCAHFTRQRCALPDKGQGFAHVVSRETDGDDPVLKQAVGIAAQGEPGRSIHEP
ncbi:MAG: hypothetical protein BWY83_02691 [bacterium ADurb.Bin478]|nr:MAG: hypothetical protein BWY83_02691 [bacterium ADurb.Bin478]